MHCWIFGLSIWKKLLGRNKLIELFLWPTGTIRWRKKWGLRAPSILLSKNGFPWDLFSILLKGIGGPSTPTFFFTKWYLWVIGTTLWASFSPTIFFILTARIFGSVCTDRETMEPNAMFQYQFESFYQEKGKSRGGGRVNLFLRLNCSTTISNIGKSKVEYGNTN